MRTDSTGAAVARVHQAGALAYVVADGEPRFLLVTSRRRPDVWIFPKGHVEPGETPEGCAARELFEEGGVSGCVVAALGSMIADTPTAAGALAEVEYYLIVQRERGEPREGRRREWLPYLQARARLDSDGARQILDAAAARLGLL